MLREGIVKKSIVTLAAALMLSPAVFAQQSGQQTETAKTKLTTEQKTELKQLRTKARTECKTDKKSEACKEARTDLHNKMNEYGIKTTGHKGWHHKSAQKPA